MQSFSSASSRRSRDSLSSNHSFMFSESEHTEDEADVFLSEGECDGGGGVDLDGPRASSAKACLTPEVFGGLAGTPLKRDQYLSRGGKTGGEGQTEGDFAFAQKCTELQGFVMPLLELLNGLKRGKYDRGLSSFQQSVAMDRIQRIVGVLQNPSMGEKHLHTLQQVEAMLKLWFPQVSPPVTALASPTPPARKAASRWRRDQLRIPMKKRRLSWTDADDCAQPAPACKRLQEERPKEKAEVSVSPPESTVTRLEDRSGKEELREAPGAIRSWPESRLSVSHPSKETDGRGGRNPAPSAGHPATQEAHVSSSTPLSPTPDPALLEGREPTRCRSEHVSTETSGRRSRPFPRLTEPFSSPEQ